MPESERVGKAFKLSVADQRITAELQRTLLYFRKAVLTSAGRRRRVVFEGVGLALELLERLCLRVL